MRRILFYVFGAMCLVGFCGCSFGQKVPTSSADTSVTMEDQKSLNDIRFANFKDTDWSDNEYIRQLRKYIDSSCNGDPAPEEGKVRDKFVLCTSEPFILGGLFVQFVFLDSPEDLFSSWVYSDVDIETETVTGYSVHGIKLEDNNSGITKEYILESMKKDPKLKLW